MADSDSHLSPQAYVLRPDVVLRLSERIAEANDPYTRTRIGARVAIREIKTAFEAGEVAISPREAKWIDRIEAQMEDIPDDECELIDMMLPTLKGKFLPAEYGL
jgi:methanol--5-hydroxybenzimidazolylcobamide Co-methyltransferase